MHFPYHQPSPINVLFNYIRGSLLSSPPPPPNSLPIFQITTHFSIFRKLFLFFTFIILSTMLSLCINLFTFFIFISTKHLYIAIQLKLFILDNLKSYVTSHLYSGLVMTYSRGRKSKAKPRKHCVFFIYFLLILLYFQFDVKIVFHI